MLCSFLFEEKYYFVAVSDYSTGANFKLPDGRILEVDGWLTSDPPRPVIVGVLATDSVDTSPIFEATTTSA